MWKKVVALAAVAGAALFVAKKVKQARDERELWKEATTAPEAPVTDLP